MHADGLISLTLDEEDGRRRIATLTDKGRAVHDDIIGMALEREKTLLSVLRTDEQQTLINILIKLHDNLPDVEIATSKYLDAHFPNIRQK